MDGPSFDLVIFLPAGDWEFNTRQRMILALAQEASLAYPSSKILCVERPICPVSTPLLHPERFLRWIAGHKPVYPVTSNLFVMTPWVLVHDLLALETPLLAKANNIVQGRQVRKALGSIGAAANKLLVWIYHPYQRHYGDMLKEDLLIYEVYDEYHEFVNVRNNQRRLRQIQRNEQLILSKANIVLTTARALFHRLATVHSQVFLVPNGVDFEHFASAPAESSPPEEFAALQRPCIGFVGKINEQLDYSLLDYLATAHPDWSLIMLGLFDGQSSLKRRADFLGVQSRPNVHFFGWKDYAVLPRYVHAFDVCLIPFVLSKLTESIYPLKLHEYLAAGKPVVSTALPEVASFREVVRIADTPSHFERHVAAALAGRDEHSRQRRMAVARDNSWGKRAETILGLIHDMLAQRCEVLV